MVLQWALVAAIAVFAIRYAIVSIHWPLMVDAPIMHYVNLLMQHGAQPYGDITDNNLPGAYLTDRWAMAIFGAGDLGWRIYEFFLFAALAAAMIVIARPTDPLAGFVAGGLFLLVHGAEGPDYAVEREQVMTVLLLWGFAALFRSVRLRRPWLMAVFGVLTALAGSIKPTVAPLALLVLGMALFALRRREVRWGRYLAWALAGFAAVFALILGFLLVHHALGGFWFVLSKITPAYVALKRPSYAHLLSKIFPKSLLPLLAAGLVLAIAGRRWGWERWALAMGALFGAFSYLVQGKDYPHHRYTFICFLFLLCCMEAMGALRRSGWRLWVGVATLLFLLLVTVPHYWRVLGQVVDHSDFAIGLEADLRALGQPDPRVVLDDKVQCFDLVAGCLNSLYHLGIVENSHFTGDMLLFSPRDTRAVSYYRQLFWKRAQADPAAVLVFTNEWYFGTNSFGKIDTWPQFRSYLAANYVEVRSRTFPLEDRHVPSNSPTDPPIAYRLYLRRGSPLIDRAKHLGWTPAVPAMPFHP